MTGHIGSVGDAAANRSQPLAARFLLEVADLSRSIESKDPHRARIVDAHGPRHERDIGVAVDVLVDEGRVVHSIQMVASENQVVLRVNPDQVTRGLTDGIGRSLEPVRVVRGLFSREHLDEAPAEQVKPVRLPDVAVERRRVELREHEDAAEVGVQAVADRDVNQPVLAPERHGRFRAKVREGEQPFAWLPPRTTASTSRMRVSVPHDQPGAGTDARAGAACHEDAPATQSSRSVSSVTKALTPGKLARSGGHTTCPSRDTRSTGPDRTTM